MSVRLILAEPYATTRASVQAFFESQSDLDVDAVASNGTEALREVQRCNPDVLLLEALLVDPVGKEVVRRTIDADGSTRPLVLSRCEESWIVNRLMDEGAYGYLLKKDPPSFVLRGGTGRLDESESHRWNPQ